MYSKLQLLFFTSFLFFGCKQSSIYSVSEDDTSFFIECVNYSVHILKDGFRFSFLNAGGKTVVPAHATSGIHFGGYDGVQVRMQSKEPDQVSFLVKNAAGDEAKVSFIPFEDYLRVTVTPADTSKSKIFLRTAGISPAYGLGEHAGYPQHPGSPASTELTGYKNDTLLALIGHRFVGRMISNFAIFPKHSFAQVNVEPFLKVFRLDENENTMGSTYTGELKNCYYFFGDPKTIYKSFLEVRNETGTPFMKPKYDFFGVGWEAWGALGWKTNQERVLEYINGFLKRGYPLEWIVIGSGFWPQEDEKFHATTSFGMWDTNLFPSPEQLISELHEKDLKVFIGLRIYFIENGPYTGEGLQKGYFIKNSDGEPKLFVKTGFPKSPCYVLDAQNPGAVDWYVKLCQKWIDYGIDGFKEDMYGYHQQIVRGETGVIEGSLRDDKVDPVNEALMKRGVYIMGRNAYLGSFADNHRIEDFNIDHNQDRGPLCGLSFAYSGLPYVYPDVVGGEPYYSDEIVTKESFKKYFSRFAMYAAVNPVMAFGNGPWITRDPLVEEAVLKAAGLHASLQPYIYSNAIHTYKTGFPYTLTPLKLTFPHDENTYALEDTIGRGYQWLIGESLMACPLYGNDYKTAETRDVYLPEGKWMDFEDGHIYEGNQTLENYPLPIGKIPLFIGGKGMIMWKEKTDSAIEAWAFPLSEKGTESVFYFPDGESSCVIKNEVENWGPGSILVKTGDNANVEITWQKFNSIRFPVQEGETYTIMNQ